MASRTSPRSKSSSTKQARNAPAPARPKQVHEIVDPRWVAKMLGLMVLLALVCAQLLVCYVFYKTQWQYVLRPSREVSQTPAARQMAYDEVHFGVDASGQPQLDGWWIPAAPSMSPGASEPRSATALLLHSGEGSMSDALADAALLRDAGLNVLLFDYRGYGKSEGRHPEEATMEADSVSALNYLVSTRGLAANRIVLYGRGVGASLAVTLASQHPELPAVILADASGDLREQVEHDRRVRVVPVGLLFNQDFPLAAPLRTLATPKLLLSTNSSSVPQAFANAHDPKTTVELKAGDEAATHAALARFLDETLLRPIPALGK